MLKLLLNDDRLTVTLTGVIYLIVYGLFGWPQTPWWVPLLIGIVSAVCAGTLATGIIFWRKPQ